MNRRSVIIGGGMLGLELARRLVAAGRQVQVLEARPGFGGIADAWSFGDFVWDRFYHVILKSDLQTQKVLAEINLAEELRFYRPKTGFHIQGRLHPFSGPMDYLRFPALNLIEKFRL
ncbi:MAG: FAD-dependent oxidoreductase, partial [Gemmataceae bacterium]